MQEFISSFTPFDYLCICVLIFCMLNGLIKGFVKQISGVLSLLLSVVISKILSIPITLKLYESLNIRNIILEKLEKIITEVFLNNMTGSIEELKLGIDKVLSKFGFIGDLVSKGVHEDYGIYTILSSGGESFIKDLTLKLMAQLEPIIIYIFGIVLFIIISIIISIIVKIIMNSISSILNSIPLVGSMNSLLGLCVGGIKGICIVILTTLICFIFISIFMDINSNIGNMLLNSRVFSLVSNLKHLIKL